MRFIAEDNSKKGIKQLPISVYVLWGGNDVFGNYGYVGCRWIHEKRFNRTEAGRKAASEWPKVQKTRVFEQLDFFKEAVGLGRIRDITFISNPDAEDYGLTSDYNEAMNGCLRHLADGDIDDGTRIKAIDSIDPSVMTLLAHRYDDVHMTYSNANRKVVSKFLHAAINTQLLAQRIRCALPAIGSVEPYVKGEPVDPVLFGWPTCLKLAKALHEYAAMEERPDWSHTWPPG